MHFNVTIVVTCREVYINGAAQFFVFIRDIAEVVQKQENILLGHFGKFKPCIMLQFKKS